MADFLQALLNGIGTVGKDIGKGVYAVGKGLYNMDPDVQRNLQERKNAAEIIRERLFQEQLATRAADRADQEFALRQQQAQQESDWRQNILAQQNEARAQQAFENNRQFTEDINTGRVVPVDPALTLQLPNTTDPSLAQSLLGVAPPASATSGGYSVTTPSPYEQGGANGSTPGGAFAYGPPGSDLRARPSTPEDMAQFKTNAAITQAKAMDTANQAILDQHFKSPEFQAFAKDNPELAQAAIVKARFGVEPTKMTLDNLGAQYIQKYQQTNDPKYLNLYHQIYPPKADESAVDPKYLQMLTKTTGAGRQYYAANDFKGDKAGFAAAQHSGIPVVDGPTDEMLSEVDNARLNLNYMLGNIQDTLATDPTGRVYQAPANTIAKISQTNPRLAAVGTYRSAAIQAMRAVAGSKGLRINKSEIEMAQQNDIPKDTDTLPTAQEKLKNMLTFLDNVERAHLVRDRSQLGRVPATTGTAPTGTIPVIRKYNPTTGKLE